MQETGEHETEMSGTLSCECQLRLGLWLVSSKCTQREEWKSEMFSNFRNWARIFAHGPVRRLVCLHRSFWAMQHFQHASKAFLSEKLKELVLTG